MNTGLLLRKPGESPYSSYRRFLIANFGCYKSTNNLRKQLIIELSKKFSLLKIDQTKLTSDLALIYEKLVVDGESDYLCSRDHKIPRFYRPRKHCPECTKVCFHSELFDLPWFNKCPVHNIELQDSCLKCNKVLPPSSEIIKNRCRVCGVSLDITWLLDCLKGSPKSDYVIFNKLHIYKVNRSLFPTYSFYSFLKNEISQRTANANSALYASILIHNKFIQVNDLKATDLPVYKITLKTFSMQEANTHILNYKYIHNIQETVIAKVSKRVKDVILKLRNEKRNSTSNINKYSDTAYGMWVKSLPYDLSYKFDSHTNDMDCYKRTCKMRTIIGPNHLMDCPELPLFMSLEYDEEHLTPIPLELSKFIYELQLWTLFIHIFNFLDQYDRFAENKNKAESLEELERTKPAVFGRKLPLYPFFFRIKENVAYVEYPKVLESDDINSFEVQQLFY